MNLSISIICSQFIQPIAIPSTASLDELTQKLETLALGQRDESAQTVRAKRSGQQSVKKRAKQTEEMEELFVVAQEEMAQQHTEEGGGKE